MRSAASRMAVSHFRREKWGLVTHLGSAGKQWLGTMKVKMCQGVEAHICDPST